MDSSPWSYIGAVKVSVSLSTFLAITGLFTSSITAVFISLDGAVIISSPQMSLLDIFLIEIVMDELYAFYLFLRGYDI